MSTPGGADLVPRLAHQARRVAGRAVRTLRPPRYAPGRPDTSWVAHQPNPGPAPNAPPVRLFAVLGTWLEADVVGATVRNAFTQGCERVYLVDNDSADATVTEAEAAGATLAASFGGEHYDEDRRIALMNDVVATESARAVTDDGASSIWWLWLDADEFPQGPHGVTIAEFLAELDPRFRIVGARFLNHYPHQRPYYLPDRHPLDFQPLCEELSHPMCELHHRKHPLQRWDADGPAIVSGLGFHMATSDEKPLLEPDEAVILHHFPYRDEDATRRRLDALCAREADGATRTRAGDEASRHIEARHRSLDAVYAGRWSKIENFLPSGRRHGVAVEPWTDLVGDAATDPPRWYPPEPR